jgi:hypothetical protein
MVYFYRRVQRNQMAVPRSLRTQTMATRTRKQPLSHDEIAQANVDEITQATVVIPPRDHEAGQCGEVVVVCDPCFLKAVTVALSRKVDLELYVLQLCENHWEKGVLTRAQLLQSQK